MNFEDCEEFVNDINVLYFEYDGFYVFNEISVTLSIKTLKTNKFYEMQNRN